MDTTTTPVLNAATQLVAPLVKLATDSGLLQDPTHPKLADVLNPVAAPVVKVIENYCDHNPCLKIDIKLF
jgi:hypothetical protein